MRWAFIAVLTLVPLCADPVRIESGQVSGMTADQKLDVRVYKGIPYAAPPVGDLRWRPPQAPVRWKGTRAATDFSASCPQPVGSIVPAPEKASEDCLYLNVWTAAKTGGAHLPVMVWIHGGGYSRGSGNQTLYDGVALAWEGVVLVTINYRLGPLGFFSHPLLSRESGHDASGNYGLMDQIFALGWVRRNIAAFGGDPEHVTIFGESAGGGAVMRLMVSPLAQGLFHRAISESGVLSGDRPLREKLLGLEPAEETGRKLARALGCETAKDPLAALRAKSADEIIAAAKPGLGMFTDDMRYLPIVDGYVMPDQPARLFGAGRQAAVPLIIGTNANEATIFMVPPPVKDLPGYRRLVTALYPAYADEVLRLYPADSDQEVLPALDRLMTDSWFGTSARFVVRSMSRVKSPAFLYQFTRVPPGTRRLHLGAYHTVEIPYIFGVDMPRMEMQEKDRELARIMRSYWVAFATTGNPNRPGLPEWPAYVESQDRHLEFGDEIRVGQALHQQGLDLFSKIQAERLLK